MTVFGQKFGFPALARLCAIAIVLITLKENLHPRRRTASDYLYFAPGALCAVAASLPSRRVRFRTRAAAGFYLGLAYTCVINSDDRMLLVVSWATIVSRSLTCLVGCAVAFPVLTHCISRLLGPGEPDLTCCQQCGYCLIGLPKPRCPECGTAISPERFSELTHLQAQDRQYPRADS
jgi:hypothetical protein